MKQQIFTETYKPGKQMNWYLNRKGLSNQGILLEVQEIWVTGLTVLRSRLYEQQHQGWYQSFPKVHDDLLRKFWVALSLQKWMKGNKNELLFPLAQVAILFSIFSLGRTFFLLFLLIWEHASNTFS